MKCSTHAETTTVGIASNVYEQLPLRAICRATRITHNQQDKWHEFSHDAEYSCSDSYVVHENVCHVFAEKINAMRVFRVLM